MRESLATNRARHPKLPRCPSQHATGMSRMASVHGSPHRKNFAWSAFILPQLEQSSIATAINFDVPFDHPINVPAAQTDLTIFQCPDAKPRKKLRGRSDYGGLYGQRITTRQNTDNGVFIFDHAHRYQTFWMDSVRPWLSPKIASGPTRVDQR